jgi:hypothetical protein
MGLANGDAPQKAPAAMRDRGELAMNAADKPEGKSAESDIR